MSFGPDFVSCLRKTGHLPPTGLAEFEQMMIKVREDERAKSALDIDSLSLKCREQEDQIKKLEELLDTVSNP